MIPKKIRQRKDDINVGYISTQGALRYRWCRKCKLQNALQRNDSTRLYWEQPLLEKADKQTYWALPWHPKNVYKKDEANHTRLRSRDSVSLHVSQIEEHKGQSHRQTSITFKPGSEFNIGSRRLPASLQCAMLSTGWPILFMAHGVWIEWARRRATKF